MALVGLILLGANTFLFLGLYTPMFHEATIDRLTIAHVAAPTDESRRLLDEAFALAQTERWAAITIPTLLDIAFAFFVLRYAAAPIRNRLRDAVASFRNRPRTQPVGSVFPRQDWSPEAAQKNMIHGACWLLGGAVVAVATFKLATSSPSGGIYVVPWGAILYGGIRFTRGFAARKR